MDLHELIKTLPSYGEDGTERARGYIGWSPYDDYMCTQVGRNERIETDTWDDFTVGMDVDLNLVADFYFEVSHDSTECHVCAQSGYNRGTRQIADDFYDFDKRGRRWCDKVTQDEVDALCNEGRLRDMYQKWDTEKGGWVDIKPRPTAEQVNERERGKGLGHDAINRCILIEARAKRLGVWGEDGTCEECKGKGRVRTGHDRLVLNLWMLHPRMGASRGWCIKNVDPVKLDDVKAFLRRS